MESVKKNGRQRRGSGIYGRKENGDKDFSEIIQQAIELEERLKELKKIELEYHKNGKSYRVTGGKVVKTVFLMELAGLKGRDRLELYDVDAVITYPGK